jgi:hypothetical protein
MSKYILLFVSSYDCEPCNKVMLFLDKTYNHIKKNIYTEIELVHLKCRVKSELNSILDKNNINIIFKKFILSFPGIFLIDKNEWDESLLNYKNEYRFNRLRIYRNNWIQYKDDIRLERINKFNLLDPLHLEIWISDTIQDLNSDKKKITVENNVEKFIKKIDNEPEQNNYVPPFKIGELFKSIDNTECPTYNVLKRPNKYK